jgi:hypothetical protein
VCRDTTVLTAGYSSNSDSEDEQEAEADGEDGDDKMEGVTEEKDPNDLTAYNLDNYDEEESKASGTLNWLPARTILLMHCCSYGRFQQYQGVTVSPRQQR